MKKGLMIVNNNVEDIESLATRDLLIRAGYNIVTATLESSLAIKTAYGVKFMADQLLSEIKVLDFDFLVLPGGKHVFEWARKADLLYRVIDEFNSTRKLIAAICAAPLFLNSLRLLDNKVFTSFPDISNQIQGFYQKDEKVVQIDNIITSRSAGTVYDFVFEIVKFISGTDEVEKLKKNIVF